MIFDFTHEEADIILGLVVDAMNEATSRAKEYSMLKFRVTDTKQYERIEAEEDHNELKKVKLLELWEKAANMKYAAEAAIKEKENEVPKHE